MSAADPIAPSPAEPRYAVPDACTLDSAKVLDCLDSSLTGLTTAEAARRRADLGPNELPEGEKHTVLAMILAQFKDFLILLLIVAAIISGPLLHEWADTIAILVIVVLNAVIGVFQEYRAERAMEALREMAGTVASVRRDGRVLEIPASELTVGDIVLRDAGRVVPADLRIVESASLRIAEALLFASREPLAEEVVLQARCDNTRGTTRG